MEVIVQLDCFFKAIATDERIGATHISLYMALFQCWLANDFKSPFSINRDQIMGMSKISARATYNKCMRDLNDYGYIKYVPSFNFYQGSIVYLNNTEKGK